MKRSRSGKARQIATTLLALLAGAIVPALIVAIVFSVSYAANQAAEGASDAAAVAGMRLSAAATSFIIALAFTAAYAFILGLPLALLGIKLRAIHWWSCILAASLIGLIPTMLVGGTGLVDTLPIGGLGAIGGLTFWLAWHFRGGGKPAPVADGAYPDPMLLVDL